MFQEEYASNAFYSCEWWITNRKNLFKINDMKKNKDKFKNKGKKYYKKAKQSHKSLHKDIS